MSRALQFGCVAIGGRGVLIEGPPGSGKSSLALALIDRGAVLVGDDGVLLEVQEGSLIAAPHPQTSGKLEVRNLGLIDFAVSLPVPVALVLRLDGDAPRYVETAECSVVMGVDVPLVRLWPDSPVLALRAELALKTYGLAVA
ncbi:MAG: serine kinase [Novosphingobium sp. 28-62-57]|uniref:HPr kinase/phosphorylase n=1 Tax=Novosphingobium sp. 28-62-57 TaxID=1970409 RepID=UPI000BD15352|nr:HPr kinase/phosphatase C-terminal domain-containing protein [Novosphingobium sp. 28-62-57]OYW48634.1 MAG: serine kinase [Novosphingobium sp. 12-62-10]OYZ10186.1 MAG: serine kinase [Novosphingobium sp. 28-62-57]OZA36007.1 MAG: serine kinase [Novosphingobium sp. 17-62-9]HQS70235.1 HPr kinase/phosphatase C-terminal domain-containing protein [Novosphingobium sp.]